MVNQREIPKVIHYCWFGGKSLPESALRCIESWKIYCPDYIIKEWNENNFDINCCDYVREAYAEKKWAFVSDYARFWILYNEGGIYFDTDVELIRTIDDIRERGSFMCCERASDNPMEYELNSMVAPGLGLGACAGLGIYKDILGFYNNKHFVDGEGRCDLTTVVQYTTEILLAHDYIKSKCNEVQRIDEIYIYPVEYFCPMNFFTGDITITSNTRSIHHYSASWHNEVGRTIIKIQRFMSKYGKIGKVLERIITLPLRAWNKIFK